MRVDPCNIRAVCSAAHCIRFWDVWLAHLRNPALRHACAIGFVFLCFLPSMVTTPTAGRIVARFGARRAMTPALAVALLGILLLLALEAPRDYMNVAERAVERDRRARAPFGRARLGFALRARR